MKDFRTWQNEFYHSIEWRKLRKDIIKMNLKNYKSSLPVCEMCMCRIKKNNKRNGYAYVDHKIEINFDNRYDEKITLNSSNLQVLCFSCHNTKTFGYDINDFELKGRANINLF